MDLIKQKISAALAGDAEAAKALLREFCTTVENNRRTLSDGSKVPHMTASGNHTQFDENLLDYLAQCLSTIGSYVDDHRLVSADIALNLASSGKRGRKQNAATRPEQLRRGMAAWKLIHQGGMKLQQAFEEIASNECKSMDTIERDYKLFLQLIRSDGK